MTGVATNKAIKVFKTQSGRPQIEWPGLTAVPVWNVVILAIPGGVVAVLPEHLGERAIALGHERVVAGETGSEFHDHTRGIGMVVSTG